MDREKLSLQVFSRRMLTDDICEFDLRSADGGALPAFEAGMHLQVQTPAGKMRCYSICNDDTERFRYVICVKRESSGRGGSRSMHAEARAQTGLVASLADNGLPLVEARRYLLIAGGIGITPILSLFRRLRRSGHPDYHLIYTAMSTAQMAYHDELGSPELRDRVTLHCDREQGGRYFDFWPLLRRPDQTHVYYCGPAPMMEALRLMTIHWPRRAVHCESFSGGASQAGSDRPFSVRQASTGRVFDIAAQQTILEALRKQGLKPASSCESGICGTCRMRVISGEVDHRDMVLSAEERLTFMMPCVSRAAGAMLELDF